MNRLKEFAPVLIALTWAQSVVTLLIGLGCGLSAINEHTRAERMSLAMEQQDARHAARILEIHNAISQRIVDLMQEDERARARR